MSAAANAPVAVLDRVSYFYPGAAAPALRDVSLTVAAGELIGVIGATGAGKSTLCLALPGIVPQQAGGRFHGAVEVGGLDTVTTPIHALARAVGIVLADPDTQLVATSVENEIAFPLENLGVPADDIRRRIPEVLAQVRLAGLERKRPDELSGGQKQRLAIAAALAARPPLLVLDEPTSQLDPAGEAEVLAVLRQLTRAHGVAVIVASHAAELLAEHADRIALLADGALAALGPPAALYADVERLRAHHLRPPQVTDAFARIRAAVPAAVPGPLPVTLADGVAALASVCAAAPCQPPAVPAAPAAAAPPLVEVVDLHHRYPDGTEALRGVSFALGRGEYVALIGENGAGKTTLVRHLLNLLAPTRGAVRLDGEDLRGRAVSALARRIGYVAQNPDHQIFNPTVATEVGFALHHLGHPPAEVAARVDASLAELGLAEHRDRHPLALAKGDRARVVIAAVLAMQPELVILDEPTTGQDDRGARAILELTARLAARGRTILVITHHLYLMPGYATRAIVLGRGAVLADAPLRDVLHQPALLAQTHLAPPQAAALAAALAARTGQPLPLVTPAEVAACFAPPEAAP